MENKDAVAMMEVIGMGKQPLAAAVAAGRRGGLAFEVSEFRLADRCVPVPVGMFNPYLMPPEDGLEDLVEFGGPDDMGWPVAWAAYGEAA